MTFPASVLCKPRVCPYVMQGTSTGWVAQTDWRPHAATPPTADAVGCGETRHRRFVARAWFAHGRCSSASSPGTRRTSRADPSSDLRGRCYGPSSRRSGCGSASSISRTPSSTSSGARKAHAASTTRRAGPRSGPVTCGFVSSSRPSSPTSSSFSGGLPPRRSSGEAPGSRASEAPCSRSGGRDAGRGHPAPVGGPSGGRASTRTAGRARRRPDARA